MHLVQSPDGSSVDPLLDVEAFSYESLERVVLASSTNDEREHVTPYYRSNPAEFELINVTSDDMFKNEQYRNRTDLRLTLEEAADYRLLKTVYNDIQNPHIPRIREVNEHVDTETLAAVNRHVRQKKT